MLKLVNLVRKAVLTVHDVRRLLRSGLVRMVLVLVLLSSLVPAAIAQTQTGSTFCGTKFNDVNGNGVQDAGESGLTGFTFELVDQGGNVVDSQVSATDSQGRLGRFCFTNIASGNYTVREVAQTGWVQTYPASPGTVSVSLNAAAPAPTLLFGNTRSAGSGSGNVICGSKFHDLNGTGDQQTNEPGLGGWTIELLNAAGSVMATTVTAAPDATGVARFCFDKLPAGTYTVREQQQSGWVQTYPASPGTHTVTIGAGSADPFLYFANQQRPTSTSSVCGTKFEDKDGNGIRDAGEVGLFGWTIEQRNAAGNVVATAVTDAEGNYCFTRVASGTHTFTEVDQPGYVQTFPAGGGSHAVVVDGTATVQGVNFGNAKSAATSPFCGTKFQDTNGNGVRDAGEPGLSGWTIEVRADGGGVVATVVTGDDGQFCFENIKAGTYWVHEVMQEGWQQTLPGGEGFHKVEVTATGVLGSALLFGNMQSPPPSQTCGIKFEDLNGNGVQDPNEPGLAGWTIHARDASGRPAATAVTDSSGKYCFLGLLPGTYTLSEVMQPNWVQTFPSGSGQHTVQIRTGHTPGSFDFGNQKAPEPCCLDFQYMQGISDGFSTSGSEVAYPREAFKQALPASARYANFDGRNTDEFVAHSFVLPSGNCVTGATLVFRARPFVDGSPDNDAVMLRFSGVTNAPSWGRYLGAGEPSPGLLANTWTSQNYGSGQTFTLDLANLPGGANLISTLNAQRFLDFAVQDDTSVDYVQLNVTFCECAEGTSTVDTAKPVSVVPGAAIRMVVGSTDAVVNGDPSRMPAPAVIQDGSTFVPFRWIGESLGAEVQWEPGERRATFILGGRTVELWIGQTRARVNGEMVTLSIAPNLINGVTFVPVRFIVENLGAAVSYDPGDRSLSVTYPR